jgi:hypothetical protein
MTAGIPSMNRMLYMYALGCFSSEPIAALQLGQAEATSGEVNASPNRAIAANSTKNRLIANLSLNRQATGKA